MSAGYWERPCAAPGLKSYRYWGRFGFVMIGAHNIDDAMQQAAASIAPATPERAKLDRWNGTEYVRVSA